MRALPGVRAGGDRIRRLAALAAAAIGTIAVVAGVADLVGGTVVALGVVLALAGFGVLAIEDARRPAGRRPRPVPARSTAEQVLWCPPSLATEVDPAAIGAAPPVPGVDAHDLVGAPTRQDLRLVRWLTAGGDDGLVVVAGPSRQPTAATAWQAVLRSHPEATVLALRPPGSGSEHEDDASSRPPATLATLAGLDIGIPTSVVVWVEGLEEHLAHGLDLTEIKRLRRRHPGALVVATTTTEALTAIERDQPAVAKRLVQATNGLQVSDGAT